VQESSVNSNSKQIRYLEGRDKTVMRNLYL